MPIPSSSLRSCCKTQSWIKPVTGGTEFECPDALDFVQCVKEALMARQYVVVETTYGGHEASIGVWGPYTHEEAHAKLRALSGDETATDSGEYGGFDFDAGDVTISVCKMERE